MRGCANAHSIAKCGGLAKRQEGVIGMTQALGNYLAGKNTVEARLKQRCAGAANAGRRSGNHCCSSCSPNISANSMVDR